VPENNITTFGHRLASRMRPTSNARLVALLRQLAQSGSAAAFDELRDFAHRGESAAQFGLGDLYERGNGGVPDLAQARLWYRRAAAQGDGAALIRLGRLSLQAPDPTDASKLTAAHAAQERDANAGDAAAQAWMGDWCRLGLSGAADFAAAEHWYRRAAAQEHVGALVTLADALEANPASPRVRAEAFGFWLTAGTLGDSFAQYQVGRHYRDGIGCEMNKRIAARWFRAAAAQDNAEAVKAVAALEAAGAVVSPAHHGLIELFVAGTGHEYLREGWSDLGIADSWTVGARSIVELPVTPNIDHLLKIEVAGIFPPSGDYFQRLAARVGDDLVGSVLCRGESHIEFFVPAAAIGARERVTVTLDLPDARRPIDHSGAADIRFLALRLAQLELIPVTPAEPGIAKASAELDAKRAALAKMQSLGINCEFGFLQRALGVEPLGLFRWTLAPLAKLVPAIEQGFAGLANPAALKIEMNDATEFVVEDTVYGFRHHSFVFASAGGTPKMVKRVEFLRVAMLTRSLIEEMRDDGKLFVYHDANQSSLADVRRLVAALRRHGNGTLLWLVGPQADAAVGEVRQLEPGLIRGVVSGFQTPVDQVIPMSPHQPSWLAVACAAFRLWQQQRG